MTTKALEEANAELRNAVATRIKNVRAGKSAENWYEPADGSATPPPAPRQDEPAHVVRTAAPAGERPGSLVFMEILEELRAVHIRKSQDYGDPTDALANIRSGADVVGIEPWRGCIIRIADKMQRIRSFCRDGKLANESFEDALLDLASYSIIALAMFRDEKSGRSV